MSFLSALDHEIIHVLVADSNQTQSQLLSGALRRQGTFKVSLCRAELSPCLQILESQATDVLLLGEGLPEARQQAELLRTIHTAYPKTRIILLLDSYDRELVVNSLRWGAQGLFCRSSLPFKALCRCIYSVHRGQYWTNTEQMRFVIDALAMGPALRVVNSKGDGLLTPREEQMVNLVAEGISNREIAQELNVKENTVKKCLLRIYDKVGVSNRVELVLYALSHREGFLAGATTALAASKKQPDLQSLVG